MRRDEKRTKNGQFALETLSPAPVTNSTNTAIDSADGVSAFLQRVKKRLRVNRGGNSGGDACRARRKATRALKSASFKAALLNRSAQTAASLNGSMHVQQDRSAQTAASLNGAMHVQQDERSD
jgi:hypothetical protein